MSYLGKRAWTTVPPAPLVLVPLGSIEQHGPHLPIDTDTTIARAVADGTATNVRSAEPDLEVFVAPAISYGSSGEHQHFPGTMSIGNNALHLMLVELVRSLSTWAGRIVVVNAHGGNLQSLCGAVTQMIYEQHDVSWVPCTTEDIDSHAGRTETSLMLHLTPQFVDMSQVRKGNLAPITELLPRIIDEGVSAVSSSGVLGDPTGATAAEGSQVLERMVEDVSMRIRIPRADHRGCLRHVVHV